MEIYKYINRSLSYEDSDKRNKFFSSVEIEKAVKNMKNVLSGHIHFVGKQWSK